MKNLKISTWMVVCVYCLALFATFWMVWFYRYHYVLAWMEESSYFSSLPDMTFLGAIFPHDALKYVGAFLLQFYYEPAVGAAIQALLPVLVFLAGSVVVMRLFQQPGRFMWLSLVPVAFFAGMQLESLDLVKPLLWVVVSWGIALVVFFLTHFWHQRLALPAFWSHACWGVVATIALLSVNVYRLGYQDKEAQRQAYYYMLHSLAEQARWDDILKVVPAEVSQHNEIAKRYALLSLMEKGLLADKATLYGVKSIDDIYFKTCNESLPRLYNAQLFKALNMPNEVIHQCYISQIYSPFGTSFGVLRQLADTYLELKDYPLAKKYLDVLSHSTVMKSWAESRQPRLEAIKHSKPQYEQRQAQFLTGEMSMEVSEMILRYPSNRKLADLFLSACLAQGDYDSFCAAYQVIAPYQYAHGEQIPACYQQALERHKVDKSI